MRIEVPDRSSGSVCTFWCAGVGVGWPGKGSSAVAQNAVVGVHVDGEVPVGERR